MIGSRSGRPIVPFAVATSRYFAVNSWDRMTINLPFSKLGIVMGNPIHVPREAGVRELELYRERVEAALNETTARAYALAGADMTRATPPSVAKASA
jgi:3-deoxy-D-manno-octulosonic-acid transferase